MITYKNVADYFIAVSNESQDLITNMKLQKLVYYTQAWFLAFQNEPLFTDDFQAWVHGPVLPALYDQYKKFQWNPILREDLVAGSSEAILATFPTFLKDRLMPDILSVYYPASAYDLERNTHNETPWIQARNGIASDEPSTAVITKDSIKEYFSSLISH